MASATITLTILDLPEIREILEEALDAVPGYEREALRERLRAVVERAEQSRRNRGVA